MGGVGEVPNPMNTLKPRRSMRQALQQTLLEIRQLNQQKRSSVSMFRVFGYDEMDAFDDTLIPSVVPKGKRAL